MKQVLSGLLFGGIALAACGQTEAPVSNEAAQAVEIVVAPTSEPPSYELVEVATGFQFPWGFAMLPDGSFLVGERDGYVSFVSAGTSERQLVSGGPEALVIGQGGTMGVALDPDFETNRFVYIAYAKGTRSENSTAIFKAKLSADGLTLEDGDDVYVAPAKRDTGRHFGGRLLFLPDGTLLLGLGDGGRYQDESQNPMNSHGTIVRINADGSIPADNPFADGQGGHPSVYTYGNRNVQGLAFDPETNTVYANEHGPKGGDEINVIEPGNNYGWPAITYGVNYNGTIITTKTEAPGMEQPLVMWNPSIAPGGMVFVTSDKYPEWKGDLLTSALAGSKLQRVDLEDGKVVKEVSYFEEFAERLRHIAQGPDGNLYVLVDGVDAGVYRIDRKVG